MKWAQFFEANFPGGWQYEPYQFLVKYKTWRFRRQTHSHETWWTPDFLVDGIGVVEVKPTLAVAEEESKKIILFAESFYGVPIWVFLGPPSDFSADKVIWAGRTKRPAFPVSGFRISDTPVGGRIIPYDPARDPYRRKS